MAAPRRLRITLEMDISTDEHRKIHTKRVMQAADEAIERAVDGLSESLTDEGFTVTVDPRVEWAYVWTDRRESYVVDFEEDDPA